MKFHKPRIILIFIALFVVSCKNNRPIAFAEIELGKELDINKINSNPNITLKKGAYYYKFSDDSYAFMQIFLNGKKVDGIKLWVSNGKESSGRDICIDSNSKNYIRNLFLEKYGKPSNIEINKESQFGSERINEKYTWNLEEMVITFDVWREEFPSSPTPKSIEEAQWDNNCLNIQIEYSKNHKFWDKEKKEVEKNDKKNI